jgi:RNA polymerase sigma-B factor
MFAPRAREARSDESCDSASSRRRVSRALAIGLFQQLGGLDHDDPKRGPIRDQLIELHMPLGKFLARRFANRGQPIDDLEQVAMIGLIKAVDRFDVARGYEFSTFASPTIVGEVKRYFRDKGWAVRVPRRLQELKLALSKATGELSHSLGRAPTVAELAAHLDVTEEVVLESLESAQAYATLSLDTPDESDDDASDPSRFAAMVDAGFESVEQREALRPLLKKLPARERRILLLRFFGEMKQSQIADEIGISQMHVSRLLARTLVTLREGMLAE